MNIELSGHFNYRRIVLSVMPSIAMMVVTSVYGIVDGLFVSNFAGTTAFASVNLVWPALMIVGALGMMVGTGGSALISKTMGEGDADKANAIFTMLVKFDGIIGIALSALLFVFFPSIARWLGASSEMMPYCITYGRVLLTMMPAYILQCSFSSLYMTAEKPQLGTIMSIVCGVANVIGDALFIGLLGWGITGAALATGLAQVVGAAFPLLYFSSRRNSSQLKLVKSPIVWHHILKTCTNGISEYVGNIAFSLVSVCYNLQLMRYVGENGVSAYGVIMYVGFVFFAIFCGYNIGITPIIGYHYGAQNHKELHNLLKRSLVLMFVLGTLITGISEATGRWTSAIFVGYDPELLDLTTRAYRIYMLSFVLGGVNVFVSALFTALNNGLISAIAALARSLVFELGCVFILPLIFGIDGIWMAVTIAETLTFILCLVLVLAFRKRYHY